MSRRGIIRQFCMRGYCYDMIQYDTSGCAREELPYVMVLLLTSVAFGEH